MNSSKYSRDLREEKPIMYGGWTLYGGVPMDKKSQLYAGASMYGGSVMRGRIQHQR